MRLRSTVECHRLSPSPLLPPHMLNGPLLSLAWDTGEGKEEGEEGREERKERKGEMGKEVIYSSQHSHSGLASQPFPVQ